MSEGPVATSSSSGACRRGPFLYAALAAVLLFLLTGGGALVWVAFWVEHSPQRRLTALMMAGMVLLVPALFVFQSTRRKLTKGRWLPNSDDIATQREKDIRRAQSPMARRVVVTVQVLAGVLLAVVWGFTDVRVVHRYGLRSWWMLYVAGFQLVLFWAYWKACRKSLVMPGWKKRAS